MLVWEGRERKYINQDLDRLEGPELNVTDNGRPVHVCTQETTTQPLNIVYGEVSFQPVVYYEEEENQEANTDRVRLHHIIERTTGTSMHFSSVLKYSPLLT
ncbi:unnamed protein product [Porites lobata]|uniref:Uncharacterized protein n=1 Tax=Porites lobata TaxID=104759 RepID=A0ABN8Q7V9_9CNID|nr:unnamed protein product [Porites lobata]